MSTYIVESLDINYSVPYGMVFMLSEVTKRQPKEIWCELSEIANVCAGRLLKKQNQRHSWTTKKFIGTSIELRIDLKKFTNHHTNKQYFKCEIKFGKSKIETFTQEQVNDYITEGILLG